MCDGKGYVETDLGNLTLLTQREKNMGSIFIKVRQRAEERVKIFVMQMECSLFHSCPMALHLKVKTTKYLLGVHKPAHLIFSSVSVNINH